ncbi:MAG: tyrosine-type recombinase/integrase [Bacteroidota bacterium]
MTVDPLVELALLLVASPVSHPAPGIPPGPPPTPHAEANGSLRASAGVLDEAGPLPAATTLDEAVELFITRTRHTRTGSAHTERAYRTDLRHYEAFLKRRRRRYADVGRRDAELYLSRLAGELAPRTVRRRISCVRSFYRYLRAIELVAANPFDALDLPDFDRKSETHKVLTDDEFERALHLLVQDVTAANEAFVSAERGRPKQRAFAGLFHAARRRAALTLMGMGGLRSAEVRGLTAEAIVPKSTGFSLTFVGKRSKIRTVPLVGAAYPALSDWLAVRRNVPASTDRVLLTLTGLAVGPKQIRRDCRVLGERVETRHKLTPHVLRRTFATRALASSGDLRGVQDLLGHATISTTEIYTFVEEEGLRAIVEGTGFGDRAPVLTGRSALTQ